MTTTAPTFREVRPNYIIVERDGKMIGSITQRAAWELVNANRWTYWQEGKAPTPTFATLEEAKASVS